MLSSKGECPLCGCPQMRLNNRDLFECPRCHMVCASDGIIAAVMPFLGQGAFRTEPTVAVFDGTVFAPSVGTSVIADRDRVFAGRAELLEYLEGPLADNAKALAQRYAPVIAEVNAGIEAFNAFVSADLRFELIDADRPEFYSARLDRHWEEQAWPSKEIYGVYFLCGQCMTNTDLGVYIGKASHIVMGHRMYAHLNPHRKSDFFVRKHPEGDVRLEVMLAAPVRDVKAQCLASALEEFLIQRGLKSARLLNHVGRRE